MPGMKDGKPIEARIFMAVPYDPGTSRIVHHHRLIQLDPRKKVSKAHVDEHARELATRHGWDVPKLKTLHVDHSKMKQGARYRVDHKSPSLVELPPRPMPQSQSPLRLKA